MTMKSDPFGMVQSATKKAFQRMERVAQVESDPDLSLYNSLKPEHFQKLMGVYGEQHVIDYIKDMESRRIMNNGRK